MSPPYHRIADDRAVQLTQSAAPGPPLPLHTLIVTPDLDTGDIHYRAADRQYTCTGALERSLPSRLQEAASALARGDEAEFERSWKTRTAELGYALFTLLFPGEHQTWGPILRAVRGELDPRIPQSTPIAGAVRVHIVTRDSRLASLPWRLVRWRVFWLIEQGWRLSVSASIGPMSEPGKELYTRSPAHVLMVAPRRVDTTNGPDIQNHEHLLGMQEVLRRIGSLPEHAPHVQVAHTREELEHCLRTMTPDLLYIYTTTRKRDDAVCLLLDDGPVAPSPDWYPVSELERVLADGSTGNPQVVYFNTGCQTPDDRLDMPLAHLDIPLVLWRTLPQRSRKATQLALSWTYTWLGESRDPVDAVHRHDYTHEQKRANPEACTLAAHARPVASWTVQQAASVHPGKDKPLLLVDREEAKAVTVKRVLELAGSRSRRVMAIVAYARPGNRIADLSKQLRHDLLVHGESQAMINWKDLRLPLTFDRPYEREDYRKRLRSDLERDMRVQLGADRHESMYNLLQRRAPPTRGKAWPVLWLDWGTHGHDRDHPALKGRHLEAWVHFAAENLARECGDNLRVISFIALETPTPSNVTNKLASMRHELSAVEQFQLKRITINVVDEEHLLDYLRDHSDCPADQVSEIASNILAVADKEIRASSNGDPPSNFAQVVHWLEQPAQGGSWYDLRDQLRRILGIDSNKQQENDDL